MVRISSPIKIAILSLSLKPVASCRECMPLATRDNSGGEDDAAQANSVATFPASKEANEKQGRKAGSWDDNPSPPEQMSDRSSRGSDRDAESRMFAGVIVQHFDDDIKCSLKVRTMI